MTQAPAAAVLWSGGKDSALALWHRTRGQAGRVGHLVTTFAPSGVSGHGVPPELIRTQAALAGLPLVPVELPEACANAVYEQRLGAVLARLREQGVREVVCGDVHLAEVRAYREGLVRRHGLEPLFPLWGRDAAELAREILAAGFEALLVSVDTARLPASFAGRRFDDRLLAELPAAVDPCGENGEFHTLVVAGPVFTGRLAVRVGRVEESAGFARVRLGTGDAVPRARS